MVVVLAGCVVITDETGRELMKHGTDLFPLETCDNDPVVDPVALHWHEELEAGIIAEGHIVVETPNKKVELKVGDGFFANSEVLHSVMPGSITPCRLHSLVFKHSIVSGSKDSAFYQQYVQPILMNTAYDFVHLERERHPEALTCIKKAWQLHQEHQPGYEIRIRSELSELLFSLQSMSLRENELTSSTKKEVYRLKLMLAYIESHYQESITLEMLANHANISESEVLRVFHNVMSTTPIKYLTQFRIQQAVAYLTQTGLKTSEISALCGFQDVSYFTKVFREVKGMPPGQFRKTQANI